MRASFIVSRDQADRRLDRVLRGLYERVPLAAIMRAVRKGEVRVDGRRAAADYRLCEGEVVATPWTEADRRSPVRAGTASPENHEKLAVLFRSPDLLCVDKPAGLLSQPDRRGGDSLITRVWRALSRERDDFRPATISRLDRNVSGVVAVALNAATLRLLSAMMRERSIGKTYAAVVLGNPPDEGEIDLPLLKDEAKNLVRVALAGQCGLPSLTRYRTLERYRDGALVELELVTGRPHQARVHLSAIGHPILGDAKYGKCGQRGQKGERGNGGVRDKNARLFLHARTLFFPNSADLPNALRGTIIESPLPKEFTDLSSIGMFV